MSEPTLVPVPIDSALLASVVLALEGMARKSTNGEAQNYARLAGELEATRARYASSLRIQPAPLAGGSRLPLPPEERE